MQKENHIVPTSCQYTPCLSCCFSANCQLSLLCYKDPVESSISMSVKEVITVVSAASLTLLRRDMSLNRRLYAWLLGADLYNILLYTN